MTSTTVNRFPRPLLAHNASVERRRVARAYGETLLMLFPLILLYWLIPIASDLKSSYNFINGTAPIYFIAVLGFLAARVSKLMPDSLWSGLFWFPVQAAVFYGFGPLVEVYGNAITTDSLARHILAVDDVELFRAHKLSTTGIAFILLGLFAHLQFLRRAWAKPRHATTSKLPVEKIGILMVLGGAAFKYVILLPAQWGLLDVTVAGVLSGLGSVTDLGFAIVAYSAARGDRWQRRFFWALWPLHLFLTVLAFAKVSVVMAMLLPLIGAYLAHRNRRKLIFGLAVTAFVYAALQPFVNYGRGVIYEGTSTISEASYSERVEILIEFVSASGTINEAYEDDRQGWWTRLNFAGPQAYAMELYDQGYANPTLGRAWIYFIPRAIWPDKPIMVGPGLEFYRLVTSRSDAYSFLGLTVYGDLYWQYGWGGVIFGSLFIGFLFAALSSQAVRAIRRRDFILLPAVLMALEMALLGPNKFVLNGIIGTLPIYFAYYFAASWASKQLSGARQ